MVDKEQNDLEIDLIELVKVIIQKWWLIFMVTIAFIAIAGLYSYLGLEDEYTAHSSMLVQANSVNDSEYTNLLTGQRLVDTYAEITKSNHVLEELKNNLSLTYTNEELKSMITVSKVKDTLIIRLGVTSKIKTETDDIANELVLIVQNLSLEYEGLENVERLDLAITPISPSGPNRPLYISIGSLLGLFTGVAIVLLFEFLDKSIKTSKDVTKKLGLRVLGVIPEYDNEFRTKYKEQYNAITIQDPHSVISEQYRKLQTNIDYSNFNKEIKVINLTSTFPEDGKSITVLNLATAYAQLNKKTIIIDLDLRKPKVHRSFKLHNKNGVTDFVIDGIEYTSIITKIDINLDVIVAGKTIPFPCEILSSTKIKELIERLKENYDRIIIDCPPTTAVSDSTIISNLVDGTVYVIASRKNNSDVVKHCVKELKENDANIIGGVLTKVQKRDQNSELQYYYYYN